MVMGLTDLINQVEQDLSDVAAVVWSESEITRAIRKTIFRYSEVRPQEAIATLAAADSREYTISTLAGPVLDVQRVWWPYDSANPDFPPKFVPFELWDDKTILYLKSDVRPNLGDKPLRIFYTKLQTIDDLDAASASTYPAEDEEVLIVGACAFAAILRARTVVDAVNPSADTPDLWAKWGNARLTEFNQELKRVARRMERYQDARIAPDWVDNEKFDDKREGSRWA
jgi:hypothetical protein